MAEHAIIFSNYAHQLNTQRQKDTEIMNELVSNLRNNLTIKGDTSRPVIAYTFRQTLNDIVRFEQYQLLFLNKNKNNSLRRYTT